MPVKLPYGPKPDAPVGFAFRFVLVLLAMPLLMALLFALDPEGPLLVGLLALLMLAVVFGAIGFAMTRRKLGRAPRRSTR